MTLRDYLFMKFQYSFHGKQRPVTRSILLLKTRGQFDGSVTDREMRTAYEDLPICGSSKGLYLPETQAEIDEQIKLHWKKIYSYFRKIDVLQHYHIESDPIQRKLF